MEVIQTLLQGMDPFIKFLICCVFLTGAFSSFNYLLAKLTIMLRGYPPCCGCVECDEQDDDEKEEEDGPYRLRKAQAVTEQKD